MTDLDRCVPVPEQQLHVGAENLCSYVNTRDRISLWFLLTNPNSRLPEQAAPQMTTAPPTPRSTAPQAQYRAHFRAKSQTSTTVEEAHQSAL